uniref:BURP domain-containing protein n=1 Tax=Panagrellus redivivus TaxID=6233 RepID=A0A7E4UPX0_PANRE
MTCIIAEETFQMVVKESQCLAFKEMISHKEVEAPVPQTLQYLSMMPLTTMAAIMTVHVPSNVSNYAKMAMKAKPKLHIANNACHQP